MIEALITATSRPWAITPEAFDVLLAIADRRGDVEALQERYGENLKNTRTATVRDGIAIIPISGPIFRYANLLTAISGATSTQILATDLASAVDNPAVRAIILEVDSPGGEATGIAEMASAIYAARSSKSITAYVGGQGASAAYWLASAATSIVVDRTALLGSIGVVMGVIDTSERDAKAGVRRVEIVSSQSPKKHLDIGSDEGQQEAQTVVDKLAGVFIADVAAYRGVTIGTVRDKFGQGGVLVGKTAVDAGMADSLGSLEGVIASLNGGKSASGTTKQAITRTVSAARPTATLRSHWRMGIPRGIG